MPTLRTPPRTTVFISASPGLHARCTLPCPPITLAPCFSQEVGWLATHLDSPRAGATVPVVSLNIHAKYFTSPSPHPRQSPVGMSAENFAGNPLPAAGYPALAVIARAAPAPVPAARMREPRGFSHFSGYSPHVGEYGRIPGSETHQFRSFKEQNRENSELLNHVLVIPRENSQGENRTHCPMFIAVRHRGESPHYKTEFVQIDPPG